jgi:hypothetical protein
MRILHQKLNMNRLLPILCIMVFYCELSFAQPLMAYVDYQNQLMVWDKGLIHKIDFLPPADIKIGRTCIPYFDNSHSFKIYYSGGIRSINEGMTNAFYATDNLVGYLNQKSLFVFDRGNIKNLTGICEQYFIADSVICYLDGLKSEYRTYYNGQTYTIESFIQDSVLAQVKVGDNIVAYNNSANQFRVFFRGAIIPQEDYTVSSFDVGRNIVAYVDVDKKFKIFHEGQTYIIDDFTPISYAAGDNLVAFVTNDGYFKIFYGDSVRNLGFYKANYRVGDNIVAFKDPSGYLQVFYKGTITEMESYFPPKMVIQYNSLAYVNAANTLRLFTEGETFDVTNADLTDWMLSYDVVRYQIGQGYYKVFYKGNDY